MSSDNNIELELLKSAVEDKIDQKILNAKDCAHLSALIFDETARRLSESTLKRVWQIISRAFNPSKYTLDTLAIFIGYKNWEDFINKSGLRNNQSISKQIKENLGTKARSITNYGLQAIHNKISNHKYQVRKREYELSFFDDFIHSEKNATALISPFAYGKSAIIYDLIKTHFLGKKAKYSNDLVWLLDSRMIENAQSRVNFTEFFMQLLGIGKDVALPDYIDFFRMDLNCRYVIILDGIDELLSELETFYLFVRSLLKLIEHCKNSPYFKFIITCRLNTWNYFSRFLNQNTFEKSLWYGVEFDDDVEDKSNVKPLSVSGVGKILKNNLNKTYIEILKDFPEIEDILLLPFFLNHFVSERFEKCRIADIELYSDFINYIVFDGILGEIKSGILSQMIEISEFGRKPNQITKDKIAYIKQFPVAYLELLTSGIIVEQIEIGSFISINTKINFCREDIYYFIIANYWLREYPNASEFTGSFFDYYENHKETGVDILCYIIKLVYREFELDLLVEIFKNYKKFIEAPNYEKINNTFIICLNKNHVKAKKITDALEKNIQDGSMIQTLKYMRL